MSLGEQLSQLGVPSKAHLRRFVRAAPGSFWNLLRTAVINFYSNRDLLWASALTYTVTLSIVPILALAFSALKGLGGIERVEPLVRRYLALGSPEVTERIIGFINNVRAATLGSVGGAALLLTVVSTLGTIEYAFNDIWQVPYGRSYLRKFTDYLSVVFTVPLLLVAALTLTASFSSRFHNLPGRSLGLPLLILWVGFFFLFTFFPYTRVRWSAAALGSFITALLFQTTQWAYLNFQIGVASYRAVYGALATIPIVLLWIYLAWLIVLFGVEICFAAQRGTTRSPKIARSPDFARRAALLALLRMAERQLDPNLVVTSDSLAGELQIGPAQIQPLLELLRNAGLIVEAEGTLPGLAKGWFLTQAPQRIRLGEALRTLENNREGTYGDPRIAALMSSVLAELTRELDKVSLSDLLAGPRAVSRLRPERPPVELERH